jgi:DNA-binding CsgD family transcriptional regulator/tetratricopeptide (TPR) repeat protein
LPLLDILASLIDKSLLSQAEQESDEARFTMLETVREYGLHCLRDSHEEEAAWQALAAYYLALAEQAELQYAGAEQVAWLQRLDLEHENLRAVLQWSILQGEKKQDMTLALRLGAALRTFWDVHGPYREGRIFLERALACREGAALALQAKALFAAANLAFLQSDFDAAEAYCQESLRLFRELGDRSGMAYALYLLAWIAKDDIAIDRALAEEALALFRELGNRRYFAWSIYILAYLDYLRGDYQNAFRLIDESLALHQELENTRGIAHSLLLKAELLLVSQGDQAGAQLYIDASIPLFNALNDQEGRASLGMLRGQLALHRKDIEQAHTLLEESLLLYKKMGTPKGIMQALYHLGRVALSENNETAACSFYQESLAIAMKLGMNEWIAACLEGLAQVAVLQGKYSWAAMAWGTAAALREAVHIPIPFIDRACHERRIALVRNCLGEQAFVALWTRGHVMIPERVIALQKHESALPPAPEATPSASTYPAGLTEREVLVLRLVAKGLTNGEIAQELGLSEKTIAHHLTHIFNKTTSENRAAAAAFAIRHGLA